MRLAQAVVGGIMRFNYPACFEPNKPKGSGMWPSDLPECHTDGGDLDDAMSMATEGSSS